MITGELKNKIDQLWEMLWTEGNANPLTNIEQLTYLLFMKDLDRVELGRENRRCARSLSSDVTRDFSVY